MIDFRGPFGKVLEGSTQNYVKHFVSEITSFVEEARLDFKKMKS